MFARTERLLLRPAWAEDAPALAEAIADEMIIRNLETAPWPYDEADAESFINGAAPASSHRFLLIKRTASNPRLIGSIALEADGEGVAKLGYWIARPYWGLGFATEAGRHMVDVARALHYSRIMAAHFADNPASGAVLRKLGFWATGRRMIGHNAARRASAPTVEYQHDLGCPETNASAPDAAVSGAMRCGQRWATAKRDEWRQHAA